ncbi:DedA family protein [Dankookia sp. GCM10030260]|uniref:DedA family protein n=1 Tax=Dankookia sp. GCM10030260 TaxID=3273390 RepID=UPI00360C5B0C
MIDWLTDLVAAGGLLGVFALMLAENLFPPLPSEMVIPLAGVAAARGQMSLPGVILAGLAGSLAGNAVWFELARAFGTERMYRIIDRLHRFTRLGREEIGQAEAALRRNGPAAVCIGRMMPGLRTGISIPAGLVALPRSVFYIWTAVGTAIWTGGLALAGYLLQDSFHLVEYWAGPIGAGLALCVVALVGWQVWKARRR